jgi:hypothetical protein
MKKISLLLMTVLAVFAIAVSSCKKKKDEVTDPGDGTITENTIIIEGDMASSQTWDATKQYLIKGKVYVQAPNVLTIPAGTIVKGDKTTQGTLIINRGAQIVANGTATQPIVFTSSAPTGFRNRGDWGGLIILGNATNNKGTNVTIEGISAASGENGLYGAGTAANETQSSGSLKFVRIEYAGIPLADDNELNSFTLGSVGSGTTLENIMVSYANDDAIEWFGGSANAKYLITFSTWDDDFDTDLGFTGKIQYGLVVREPAIADKSTSRVWESSSSATAATPTSAPVFSNVTVLGPLVYAKNTAANEVNSFYGAAIEVNSNSAIKIHNSIVLGFTDQIRTSTPGAYSVNNTLLSFANTSDAAGNYGSNDLSGSNILEDSLKDIYGSSLSGRTLVPFSTVISSVTQTPTGRVNNLPMKTNSILGYVGMNPSPVLDASSTYLTGAPSVADFTSTPSYYGAFGSSPDAGWEWSSGWVNFNPNSTTY